MNPMRALATLVGMGLFATSLCAAALPSRKDAEKDPVIKAMLEELDRSMSQLQLPGFQKPFFIQYRIEDVEDFQTHASFGASLSSDFNHARVARVTVRVGNYKTDSSTSRGDGAIQLAALEDDPIALRSALWSATDQAYKSALASYAKKQAALKQVQTPPQADDLSHEQPTLTLDQPIQLHIDEAAWTARVARFSGLYRTASFRAAQQRDVQYASAVFQAHAVTIWLVNSEGSILRTSAATYQEGIAAGTQAADGMHLDRSYASTGPTIKDLDSPELFEKRITALIASLGQLRAAPLVEDEYHGPVLLSADASTDTFRALVAPAVVATRPPLGTEARTNGPFASSYRTRVLPDFMDVTDEPDLKSYNGIGLIGSYSVDDEAVPAQTVPLVTNGRLENYLIGREPVRDFPRSNGHGRVGITGPPAPSIGVLKISAINGLSEADLHSKLLAAAKDAGLKNVYEVETLGPGMTPRLLYRIGPDGVRQLVRGAELDDLDQRTLRSSVLAAGKDLWVTNYFGDIPQTVLAPALLLDDVTIRRANEKNEKLPFYPPPE
jgi:predicted Zn-dependent protease